MITIIQCCRYYLSPRLYPQKKLPTFVSGGMFIFTGSLLSPLYKCALRTPLINLEDVFLTGLCARQQLGLRFTDNKNFIPRGPESVNAKNVCVFKNAVVVHNKYKPKILEKLWTFTTRNKAPCHVGDVISGHRLKRQITTFSQNSDSL